MTMSDRELLLEYLRKHDGPGPHPGTGTTQEEAHDPTKGSGGGSSDKKSTDGKATDQKGGSAPSAPTGAPQPSEGGTDFDSILAAGKQALAEGSAPQPGGESTRAGGRSSRPVSFDEIIGADRMKTRLQIMAQSAKKRGAVMDHVLFAGPPGLGKTTFARALANELGKNIRVVTAPALDGPEDVMSLLLEVEEGDVLFIDEIHALDQASQEILFPAMEDFQVDWQAPTGETIRLGLPEFTLVGATTEAEGLMRPLRDRFGNSENMDYYSPQELADIATATSAKRGVELTPESALEIGRRARGTPRIANRLIRRVSDYAIAKGVDVTPDVVDTVLSIWDIDSKGLTRSDRTILSVLNESGGPVGLNTLAARIGETEDTIYTTAEPYLLREGLIERTGRGRTITEAGRRHLLGESEDVAKHGGPGKHKNGTGQEVHGSGSRDATPSDMLSRARSQGGGASIHVLTGKQPTSGYAVAVSGLGIEVDPESVTPEMVGKFRAKHYSYFEQDEYVLGLWESPNTGQLWLDVTRIVGDRQEAIDMMMNSTEEGIWDFAAGDEIMREDVAKRRRRTSLLASLIKRNRSNP